MRILEVLTNPENASVGPGAGRSELDEFLRQFGGHQESKDTLLSDDEFAIGLLIMDMGADPSYSPSMLVIGLLRELMAKLSLGRMVREFHRPSVGRTASK